MNTLKPYILSVSALVRNAEGSVLFLQRAGKSRWHPGFWEPPGGKPNPGEIIQDAVLREVEEETGLRIRLAGIAGAADFEHEKARVAVLYFLAASLSGDRVQLGEEHDDWRWVSQGEIAGLSLTPPAKALFTRASPETLAMWFTAGSL